MGCAITLLFIALPLSMKSLSANARENILTSALRLKLLDSSDEAQVQNARRALGISHEYPFYYSTMGVRRWLSENPLIFKKLISNHDDLILLNRAIVGPRQLAVAPFESISNKESELLTKAFFETEAAFKSHDLETVMEVGKRYGADTAVVPWKVDNALYQDSYFSVVRINSKQGKVRAPLNDEIASGEIAAKH
jgi:hypothetical protein